MRNCRSLFLTTLKIKEDFPDYVTLVLVSDPGRVQSGHCIANGLGSCGQSQGFECVQDRFNLRVRLCGGRWTLFLGCRSARRTVSALRRTPVSQTRTSASMAHDQRVRR
jgi:hypothetical protein